MDKVTEFDRSKIYENLDYQPEPKNYSGKIPWKVQQQISATNGIHYKDTVGYLNDYPIPTIPVPQTTEPKLLLDIGCGWGRWLVSSARKNYIPIGADLRLEFCETALKVLRDNGLAGYTVVADLKDLPFRENTMDVVWSFSVIQHTHKDRLLSCINQIYKILKGTGYCLLEFPNKKGIRNRFGPVQRMEGEKNDYNSWNVRYYTIKEYKSFFYQRFKNFSFKNHSFLGIGVLSNDLDYVRGFKNKLGIALSLFLSKVTQVVTPLKYLSDSVYIKCIKKEQSANDNQKEFFERHLANPNNNLNIVSLLACPISGGKLVLDEDNNRLFSPLAKKYFPIVNDIPILIASEAFVA